MRKLPPDRRADLRHLLGRPKPVEPRHQRGLQACRYRQSGGWNGSSGLLRCALAPRFQYRLGHFLHEQGNAIGALDDVLPNVRWEQLVADDAVDHRADFALCQPIDGEGGDVRPSDPGRLELWPERHEKQHRKGRVSGQLSDQALPSSLGRSNGHPRRPSAPDFGVSAPRPGK